MCVCFIKVVITLTIIQSPASMVVMWSPAMIGLLVEETCLRAQGGSWQQFKLRLQQDLSG